MKTIQFVILIFLSLVLFGLNNAFAESYGKQKVVYHINYDDPQTQAGALGNIKNHINAVGAENMDVRVVLHGSGLSLLLTPEAKTKLPKGNADQVMAAKVAGLKDLGVKFNVCANTLKGKEVNFEKDMYDVQKEDIVPSGVAELSHLQTQGFTYIKP